MLSYEVEIGDWKGISMMFNWSKNLFFVGFVKFVVVNLNKVGIKCVYICKDKVLVFGKLNLVVNLFLYNFDYVY